ncbi:glycosyltransferase family 62 protein [Acidomyces richmondensis BFW]|nr:MAG: glycosyltransferase family 62 protein [Acidomyces sp. 'richmondensis']KYG43929.1 glycosyltransferase family 62 protein [Acidomyces richmondensis BFW]
MSRSIRRFGIPIVVILVLWILFYNFEPRRTAYSCRTFWSCVGFGSRNAYGYSAHYDSLPLEQEKTLNDGTLRFTREAHEADPELLFLVLVKDAASWSSDFRSSSRSTYDLLDILVGSGLDLSTISLAIMVSSPEVYEEAKTATGRLPFARVSLLQHRNTASDVEYRDRHNPAVQLARRSALAALRNRLMVSALRDEKHIVWLDADVVEMSDGVVQAMLHQADVNEDAGIITVMCHQNQMDNYDKNAWKLSSNANLLGVIDDAGRQEAISRLVETRQMLPELVQGTQDDELVGIDSVGGTLLYIRAELVRQGVNFPHFNVVGTTWSQFGWIGVETEGICYMARGLKGGGCYVLGGHHHVRHADWG